MSWNAQTRTRNRRALSQEFSMKVVVAIDRSPSSQTVLQRVVSRPWPANTTFCVLNVVDVLRFERLPAIIEDAEREGIQIAESGARRISSAGYEAFPYTALGNPRADITCYAKEWGADLILVGSHGHSAIARFLVGSVALAVMRTAPCTVEIVRHAGNGSPFKVLFATDGSEFSSAAARLIADQVWPKESLFKILSVEELMTAKNQMDAASLSSVYPASLLEELVTQAHDWARLSVSRARDVLGRAGLAIVEGE